MKNLEQYRGGLIGGAAGDALGYAVEFPGTDAAVKKYGKNGITNCKLHNGIAPISSVTQMMLFTANGLLLGTTRGMTRGIMGPYPAYIAACYKDWLQTQSAAYPLRTRSPYSWLVNEPELFARRDPGNTCISAIINGADGTIDDPMNQSKGCGGMVRVAPIGLYLGGRRYESDKIDMIGAETAALTHGHELGYIPAAAFVHIIQRLSHNEDISLYEAVRDTEQALLRLFDGKKYLDEQIRLIDRAIELSNGTFDDLEAVQELGQGWTAEETLAIAIYCSLKYSDDFEQALIAAVNHSGASSSTGAVTGSIMGTYLGYSSIPDKYIENLELKNVILELADDLYHDCRISEYSSYHDRIWEQKYIKKTYAVNQKRFAKEIFLFDTYIAGTTHVKGIEELEPYLNEDDELDFIREPDNKYDSQAIAITTADGIKLGYVPREDNKIAARLMDAGKILFGRISMKEKKGSWIKIHIKVFLRE